MDLFLGQWVKHSAVLGSKLIIFRLKYECTTQSALLSFVNFPNSLFTLCMHKQQVWQFCCLPTGLNNNRHICCNSYNTEIAIWNWFLLHWNSRLTKRKGAKNHKKWPRSQVEANVILSADSAPHTHLFLVIYCCYNTLFWKRCSNTATTHVITILTYWR